MKNLKVKFLVGALILGSFYLASTSLVSAKTVVKKAVAPKAKVVVNSQNQIKKFTNLADFKKFIENNVPLGSGSNYSRGNTLESWGDLMPMAVSGAKPMMAPSAKMTTAVSDDFSTTNVQVAGVDEADIVKTDGRYVYSVSDNDVIIVDAGNPSEAKVLTTINFKDQPQDIYLDNNKLLVIGYDYNFYPMMAKMNFIRRSNYTFLKVFDVSDKLKPREVRSLRIEGDYTNSRLINGYLYLLTNSYNYTVDKELLPRIYENDKLINATKTTGRYIMPNIYYFDMPYHNLNLTTVSVVDLKNDNQPIKTEVYALPSGETVYASQEALYIAYGKYLDQAELMMKTKKEVVWSQLDANSKDRITKIEAVENFILNSDEKLNKVNQIIDRYVNNLADSDKKIFNSKIDEAVKTKILAKLDQLQVTVVHKIGIKGQTLNYQGFVEVPGRVLNQFALDEAGGYLRVATTRDAASNFVYFTNVTLTDKRSNGLYVIDDKMKMVGRLEGLAPNEQIYSVRFMQNRAYLVTFQQTDPLFVIDLSKPTAPKVLGELKVPGFSQYLHPYNDNILIGLGRSTDDMNGRVVTAGLKLSLFDVSNVSAPKEISTLELGGRGSNSAALDDHKAFLFSRDKNLIVIPASLTKEMPGQSWGEVEFNGALVFRVDDKSLVLKGKISHNNDYKLNDYQNNIKRTLYIGNNLLTVSDNYLQINQLDNLSEVNKLPLHQEVDYKILN